MSYLLRKMSDISLKACRRCFLKGMLLTKMIFDNWRNPVLEKYLENAFPFCRNWRKFSWNWGRISNGRWFPALCHRGSHPKMKKYENLAVFGIIVQTYKPGLDTSLFSITLSPLCFSDCWMSFSLKPRDLLAGQMSTFTMGPLPEGGWRHFRVGLSSIYAVGVPLRSHLLFSLGKRDQNWPAMLSTIYSLSWDSLPTFLEGPLESKRMLRSWNNEARTKS